MHAPRLNLEPNSQGDKHPSSDHPKTINAAQKPQSNTKGRDPDHNYPTKDEFLNIKTGTYNHLLYTQDPNGHGAAQWLSTKGANP